MKANFWRNFREQLFYKMKVVKSKYKNRLDDGLESLIQFASSQIYQRIGNQITRIDQQTFHLCAYILKK